MESSASPNRSRITWLNPNASEFVPATSAAAAAAAPSAGHTQSTAGSSAAPEKASGKLKPRPRRPKHYAGPQGHITHLPRNASELVVVHNRSTKNDVHRAVRTDGRVGNTMKIARRSTERGRHHEPQSHEDTTHDTFGGTRRDERQSKAGGARSALSQQPSTTSRHSPSAR